MKKILLCVLLLLMLTGCEKKVSQGEYDNLKADYEKLQTEQVNLKSSYEELVKENEENAANYEEYLNKYSEVFASNFDEDLILAWGKSVFGDSTQCGKINNEASQLIITISSVDKSAIQTFINNFYDNLSTLKTTLDIAESVAVTKIYLKVISQDCIPIMEVYINLTDYKNVITKMMINPNHMDVVYDALN